MSRKNRVLTSSAVKVVRIHAMKAYRGSGGTKPLNLNLGNLPLVKEFQYALNRWLGEPQGPVLVAAVISGFGHCLNNTNTNISNNLDHLHPINIHS
jgi:hypothetical protein